MSNNSSKVKLFISIRIHIQHLIRQITPKNIEQIMHSIIHPFIDCNNTYKYKQIFNSIKNDDDYTYDILDIARKYGHINNPTKYATKIKEYLSTIKEDNFYIFLNVDNFYDEIINISFTRDTECSSFTSFETMENKKLLAAKFIKELELEDCEIVAHLHAFNN